MLQLRKELKMTTKQVSKPLNLNDLVANPQKTAVRQSLKRNNNLRTKSQAVKLLKEVISSEQTQSA
jgi:hypothetical protein